MRHILVILVLLLSCPGLAAVGHGATPAAEPNGAVSLTPKEKAWLKQHEGPVVAGAEMDWPPFDFVQDGNPTGYSNELLRLAARKAGLPLKIVFGFTWAELLEQFEQGKIDILPAVYKTPERARQMAFTKSYAANPSVLVTSEKSPELRSLRDLSGRRLAVVEGFSITRLLLQTHPGINQVPVGNVLEGLKAVSLGKADAFIGSLGVISYILRENLIPYVRIVDEIVLEKSEATQLHMVTLKDRAILRDILQKGLGAVTPAELSRLKQRWLPISMTMPADDHELVLTPQDREWLAEHPAITLGINPDQMPFEGLGAGGEFQGISAGVIDLIGTKLGIVMHPELGLTWPQALDKAKQGKVDLLPLVTPSPQRQKYLIFTQPYLSYPAVLVTRNDAPVITGLAELKGAKVAVPAGDALVDRVRHEHPSLQLQPVQSLEQGLAMVARRQVGAYLGNMVAINFSLNRLGLTDLKIAAITKYKFDLAMGVRKDWPQLASILQKALSSLTAEEKAAITSQWAGIRFAQRTNWRFIAGVGGGAAAVVIVILAIIITWNRRLRREVDQRAQAERRLQALAANVPGVIFQARAFPDGRRQWLYVSQQAKLFYGVGPEEVIKEDRHLAFHPEDRERMEGEIQEAFAARVEHNVVGRILLPDGGLKWVNIKASPARGEENELVYTGFILDVTERKLAEMEYLAAERKVQAMSQAVEDALIMIDGQGKVLFWNQAAQRLFGYTQEEAMGMDFHAMAAPEEYHAKIGPGLERFARTGQGAVLGVTTEITARNRSGERFPVEVTLSSFKMDESWYAVGTVRDISARKQGEQALRDSQRRMADIIEFLPSPTLVVDTSGHVLFWNRSMERLTGVKKEDMLGKGDYEYALPFYGERRPILVDLVRDWNEETARKYLSIKRDGHLLVSESRNPNLGDEEIYLSSTAALLYDADGREIGAIETFRDISERKRAEALMVEKEVAEEAAARAEKALAEIDRYKGRLEILVAERTEELKLSEERSRLLLESAGEGIFGVDSQGRVSFINPAALAMLGYAEAEIMGKPVHALIHHSRADGSAYPVDECPMNTTFTQGTVHHVDDEVLWRKDGRPFPVEYASTPISKDGQVMGAVITFRDVSERKAAEDRLRRNLDELERFNRLVVGREVRMVRLKEEVNQLLEQAGQAGKYKIVDKENLA